MIDADAQKDSRFPVARRSEANAREGVGSLETNVAPQRLRKIIGGPAMARHVAQVAPPGYKFIEPGFGYRPGYICAGPDLDNVTTVCLLEGDTGTWFKEFLRTAFESWWRAEGEPPE